MNICVYIYICCLQWVKSEYSKVVYSSFFEYFLRFSLKKHISSISISTFMRPMRMVIRWFWVKARMAWCTLGGTWATKYASPLRKSLKRTARMRNWCFVFVCFFPPHLNRNWMSCSVFSWDCFSITPKKEKLWHEMRLSWSLRSDDSIICCSLH